MPTAFWAGVLAGYGIAVPVGAIAVLIVETGLQRGFAAAFAAGAGAATADLVYAAVAALAGVALAVWLRPAAGGLRVASGLALVALGVHGLFRLWRQAAPAAAPRKPATPAAGLARIYAQFLGLTLLNPLTVAYFGALILGMQAGGPASSAARLAFVGGAALASLSWQSLLAGIGALGNQRLSPRFRALTSIAGHLIILAFGLRALLAL